MTLGELKAFIEGMAIADCPTPEQWKRIAEKLEVVMPEKVVFPAPVQPLMPPPWPRWGESPTVGPPEWKPPPTPWTSGGPSISHGYFGHQQ